MSDTRKANTQTAATTQRPREPEDVKPSTTGAGLPGRGTWPKQRSRLRRPLAAVAEPAYNSALRKAPDPWPDGRDADGPREVEAMRRGEVAPACHAERRWWLRRADLAPAAGEQRPRGSDPVYVTPLLGPPD